jgi:hypothetical protein
MPADDRFKNYYEVLRVRPNDSPELIQAAFIVQIKQWHPDRFATADDLSKKMAQERAKIIIEAKRILLSPSLKAQYDKEFEIRFPRRWEKLNGHERVKQRQITVEELQKNGIPINSSYAFEHERNPDEGQFKWLNFSSRVNPLTQRVTFNATHFLDLNPQCEIRFKFNYNLDWQPFTKQKVFMVDYSGDVAIVEMQARHVSKSGKSRYSKRICRTLVITRHDKAMKRREEILRHQKRLCNRLGLKLIIALLGSALSSLEIIILLSKPLNSWI